MDQAKVYGENIEIPYDEILKIEKIENAESDGHFPLIESIIFVVIAFAIVGASLMISGG